jgi:hypothetical protein
VIRRYDTDRVTVIVLANRDDGGGVDAISRRIAGLYVSGADIHGLAPVPDPAPDESARLRKTLATMAGGVEDPAAPGLAARVPREVRDRIAAAVGPGSTFELLGDEAVGRGHFNLDPSLARIRRYRAGTPRAPRYLTIRLAADGRVLGVIVED